MDIRPVDLPDLRTETLQYVQRLGQATYERSIASGRQFMKPAGSPVKGAAIISAEEVRRLAAAELFYVSADMTDLAIAAGTTLPSFSLMPEDLPTPTGLIYFAKPIWTVDYENDDGTPAGSSPIVAASWSYWTGGIREWVHGGIWVTWYAERDVIIDTGQALGLIGKREGEVLRRAASRLLIDNESQCPFSPDPIPTVDQTGRVIESFADADGLARWLGTLKTAWLLMNQPVASVSDAQFDRAARRRMPKGQEPPRVRVITLRRPAGSSHGESDREYHHQWIVRGHWRQQWYPARQVHRPVWIAPHVKGPEGAPMLGGEKVYAWSR